MGRCSRWCGKHKVDLTLRALELPNLQGVNEVAGNRKRAPTWWCLGREEARARRFVLQLCPRQRTPDRDLAGLKINVIPLQREQFVVTSADLVALERQVVLQKVLVARGQPRDPQVRDARLRSFAARFVIVRRCQLRLYPSYPLDLNN